MSKPSYYDQACQYGMSILHSGVTLLSGRTYNQNDITGYGSMGPTAKDVTLAKAQQREIGAGIAIT